MRSLGRALGRGLVGLITAIVALWLVAPREPVERSGPAAIDIADPAGHLAAREAGFDDIRPGTEARIVWADAPGTRTDLALVYLHGFSASSEEIRPVPDQVAAALGANLVFARLTGHGRDGPALAEARAGDWIDDTAEILAVARAVGDRVVILGTSTGATLAAIAMTEPDMAEDVAAVAMISPNFRLASPAGRLLDWPYARIWVPLLVGESRSFEPVNDGHAAYWTVEYPTIAALPLAALMRAARMRDYAEVQVPLILLYAQADRVVSARAALDFAQGWGGPVTLAPQELPETGADPFAHVLAGDVLSPAMTEPVIAQLVEWVTVAVE